MMETTVHDPEHDDDDDDDWEDCSNSSVESSMHHQDAFQPQKCSVCGSPYTAQYRKYWDCTLVDLESAAVQNGCIQCQPIYELIKLFVPDGFHGSNKIFIDPNWNCTLSISSGMLVREDKYQLDIFRLHGENCRNLSATSNMLKKEFLEPKSIKGGVLESVPIKDPYFVDTSSEETLQCIKKWIKECDSEHTLCAPTRNSAQLHGPKRILDLRFGKIRVRDD